MVLSLIVSQSSVEASDWFGFGYRRDVLWVSFCVIAIPTAILWYSDRRTVKPGHCPHCGYNLTGNESGVCPECATAVPEQKTTA